MQTKRIQKRVRPAKLARELAARLGTRPGEVLPFTIAPEVFEDDDVAEIVSVHYEPEIKAEVEAALAEHDPDTPDETDAAQAEAVAEREADRGLLVREAVADALSQLAVGIGQAEGDLAGIDTADLATLRAILRRTVNRQRLMLEFLRRLLRVVRWLAT